MDNIKRNSQENHFVINFIIDIHFVSANLIHIGSLDTELWKICTFDFIQHELIQQYDIFI